MLRVRVGATHMGGFLGPKFSKQRSFFDRFSLNKGGFPRNWQKIVKNGWFSTKIHHKSWYDGNCWQLEKGSFAKTGRQTPVHLQVMYPPPSAHVARFWLGKCMHPNFKSIPTLCTYQFFRKVHPARAIKNRSILWG